MNKTLKTITFLAFITFAISASMLDGEYWLQALGVAMLSFSWLALFGIANSRGGHE